MEGGGRRSVGVHSWKLDRKGVRGGGGGVVLEGEKGEGRVAGREGEGLQGEKGRGCRERRGGVGGRDALQPLPSL